MKILIITLSILAANLCNAQITFLGTSSHGGINDHGTLFSVTTTGSLDTLFNFNLGDNGCTPGGSMVLANDGNYYGFTQSCGVNSVGTLIRYNPFTKLVTTVIDFDATIGDAPLGSPVLGIDGALYGLTNAGGSGNGGTLFKCTTTGMLTVLVTFTGSNGLNPTGNLVQAPDGSFYGVTRFGGTNKKGIIFKYNTLSGLAVLHNFAGTDGLEPIGSLTLIKDSLLYGLTYGGGTYKGGVIFYCSTTGNYKMLTSFNSTIGMMPFGSLLNPRNGYLYGTTYSGGAYFVGTLFKCDDSGSVTVLANFNDSNGAHPTGTPILASDGKLYGTTVAGGLIGGNSGVIYSYNIASNILTDVYQFSPLESKNPMGDLLEITNTVTTSHTIATTSTSSKIYPNPNKGQFTLDFGSSSVNINTTNDNLKFEVYNMLGQIVSSVNMNVLEDKNSINIGSQPTGMYIYKVVSDNSGLLANGRFVIQ